MWSRLPALTIVVLAVLVLVGGCRQTAGPTAQTPPIETPVTPPPPTQAGAQADGVGKRAPDFTVTDIDGKTHSLKDYAGKILVVDFWATYCKPCVEHLRDYDDAAYELSKQGVEFLALSNGDSEAEIKGWRPEGFDIPLAALDDKTHKAFFGDVAIVPIPQVRIIDRKGILRYSLGPDATSAQVKDDIKTLLAEK